METSGDSTQILTILNQFSITLKIIIYRPVFIFYLFDKISILPVKKKEIEILKMCI